jgi:GTP-binding protein HflX
MTLEPKRAVIVAVQLPETDDVEFTSSLEELERLVKTLGYRSVARVIQARPTLSPSAVLGEGKLEELAELTGGGGRSATTRIVKKSKARLRWEKEEPKAPGRPRPASVAAVEDDGGSEDEDEGPKVDLVAVDHELSPSQARNLEKATGAPVLDRTGVIIEIFHHHAKSREARLQVELARLAYTAPRVRESPSGKERQAGRGAGEAAIELDRRRIRDRMAELREQLEAILREQGVRRAQRRSAHRVALVGYTNAGKSSLMRALTGSDVLVEDKLFATLDTTVRALVPAVKPRVLVSDTVGFIKKLPHDLVASFQSTLDEALEASLLLHVVDASDPAWEAQLAVTKSVLNEIGAADVPSRLVMNKIDRVAPDALEALQREHPDAWFVSAHAPADVARVHSGIVRFFEDSYTSAELLVPYSKQRLIAEMHEQGRVESERYEDDGVHVAFRSDKDVVARFRAELGG